MSDNNMILKVPARARPGAKFALVAVWVGGAWGMTGLWGCTAYTPASATVPATLPMRITGREDAMMAAMRAAVKHQELTVVGAPQVEANQTTFMLLGTGDVTGVVVVTKVAASAVTGESDVVVTASIGRDADGTRAGRLAADFRQRWEQLRGSGFAPLPPGWQ